MADQVRTLRPSLYEVSMVVFANPTKASGNCERFKLEHEHVRAGHEFPVGRNVQRIRRHAECLQIAKREYLRDSARSTSVPRSVLSPEVMEWIGIIGGALGGLAAAYTAIRIPKVEELRSRLRRSELRNSRLYDHQLEAITATWERMVDAHWAVGDYVIPMRLAGSEPVAESGNRARSAFNQLLETFEHRRILLPEGIADQADALIRKLRRILNQFDLVQADPYSDGSAKKWGELWDETRDDVRDLRRAFEKAARALLGAGPAKDT